MSLSAGNRENGCPLCVPWSGSCLLAYRPAFEFKVARPSSGRQPLRVLLSTLLSFQLQPVADLCLFVNCTSAALVI